MPRIPSTSAFLPGGFALPPADFAQTDLVYHAEFEILGTENVGDRKEFGVDPAVLPTMFDWQIGNYYLYNGEGSMGVPSGIWHFEIWTDYGDGAGLSWRLGSNPLPRDLSIDFPNMTHRMVKPAVHFSQANAWSSSAKDGGIRFSIVCDNVPTVGAAKLVAGLTGNITYY